MHLIAPKPNQRGQDLWKEVTNYNVNFFTPAKMEISIQTRDSHKSAKKYGTSVMTYHLIIFLIKRFDNSKINIMFYFIQYFISYIAGSR